MRLLFAASCLTAACTPSPSSPAPPDAAVDAGRPDTPTPFTPDTCNGQPLPFTAEPGTLYYVGPLDVATTETRLCLVLDASAAAWNASFMALTAEEPTRTPSLELALTLPDGTPLATGEEETYGTYGSTQPGSAVRLTYWVPMMQTQNVELHLRAKETATTTWLDLSLRIPLD
jgi:hypothetical protein